MMAPLLSLVVPVYNVAPYLARCLDSLVAQTRPVDEIVVVDDGSTDRSPEILASYADRLPQMRVIRQENGGLSAARNTGMRHATGRYLAFLDSDDFVAPEIYEVLLGAAQQDDLDMVLCNGFYHFEGREPDRPIYQKGGTTPVLSGAGWMGQQLHNDRVMHMVWMHLYRRSFLVDNAFAFVPRLIHEDVIWTTRALLRAPRVRYLHQPLYYYRIPIRTFTPERNRQRLADIVSSSIMNARSLIEMADEETTNTVLQRQLREQAVDGAFSIFHKIEKIPDPDWQRERFAEVDASGLFPLLWRNAVGWRQHRKLMRNYLRFRLALARTGKGTRS